jgi:hypothetical protein
MQKRTIRIDGEREIFLRHAPDGSPIFTTAADLALSPANKEALSSNLQLQRRFAEVDKLARGVLAGAAAAIQEGVRKLMPPEVLTALEDVRRGKNKQDGETMIREWWKKAGIEVRQDGLKTVLKYRNRVLLEAEPRDIPPSLRGEVARRITQLQRLKA